MAYLVTAPLVIAVDKEGRSIHHYHGAIIAWLNDQQREHFTSSGFVQLTDDTSPPASDESELRTAVRSCETQPDGAAAQPVHQTSNAEPVVSNDAVWDGLDTDRVHDCLHAIAGLGIPGNTGSPKTREALRKAGHAFGNDVISAAVRARKQLSGQTSRSPAAPRDWPQHLGCSGEVPDSSPLSSMNPGTTAPAARDGDQPGAAYRWRGGRLPRTKLAGLAS